MTILAPPAAFAIPSRMQLMPIANTQSGGRSPFDASEQTLEQPGRRWGASLAWEGLAEAEWRPMLAFLAELGGMAGRFAWAPPIPRRGTTGADPGAVRRVRLASQTGTVLDTTGWADAGVVARAGDLVGWADPSARPQLHMVTADVASAPPTSTNLQVQSVALVPGAGDFAISVQTTDLGAVADPEAGTAARRLRSTNAVGSQLSRAAGNRLTVTPGATYAVSIAARLNAGALGTGRLLSIAEYTAAGTSLGRQNGPALTTLGLDGTWRRIAWVATANAAAERWQLYWAEDWTAAAELDLFGPQVEARGNATPHIRTTTTAATRTQSILLPVAPPIRRSPAVDTPLTLDAPTAVWRLGSDRYGADLGRGIIGGFQIEIEEAIP